MSADPHIPYEALARYLSKKIDADERESIDRHVQDCPYCRQDLSDAQAWRAAHPEIEPEPKKSRWAWLFPWRKD